MLPTVSLPVGLSGRRKRPVDALDPVTPARFG